MPNAYDFNETVELLDLRKAVRSPDLAGFKRATMPLHEAVSTVIEEWAGDKFRQLSAVILTRSGKCIRSLEEIKRLHTVYRS